METRARRGCVTLFTMLYRVDYMLAVMAAGAMIGWIVGRVSRIDSVRLARGYYLASLVSVVVRIAATFLLAAFGDSKHTWMIARDLGHLVIGSLFGLWLARRTRGPWLREPEVLDALCVSTGAWFALGGLGSMFLTDQMTEFFQQSGYSPAFLRVIVTVEIVGGLALLVRWAVPLGLAALAVDMFGAIYTHLRNHDGIDADMDALAMLVRLATIAMLWLTATLPGARLSRRLALAATGAALCLVAAIAGAQLVHRT